MVAMTEPQPFRQLAPVVRALQFREGDRSTQEHVNFGYPAGDGEAPARPDLVGKHWVHTPYGEAVLQDGDWVVSSALGTFVIGALEFTGNYEPVQKPVGGDSPYRLDVRDVLTRGSRATDPELVRGAVHQVCTYHAPTAEMTPRFAAVSKAIEDAVVVLVENCPPSGDRTAAVRALLDARMTANRSISLGGVF